MMTNSNSNNNDRAAALADEVSALRPDLAANETLRIIAEQALRDDPNTTAADVIAIADEASAEWAAEQAHEASQS